MREKHAQKSTSMGKGQENKETSLKPLEIKPLDELIINEYLNNGNNKTRAVLKHKPDISYNSTRRVFKEIEERPEVQKYLKARQLEIKEKSQIKSLEILNKLQTWLNSDPSDFIGLTKEDVKQLPAEVRQCIQAIDYKTKTYVNRQGEEVKEEHLKLTLVDKIKTIDMINKHIGFYSEDNKQKGGNTNILIQTLAKNNPDTLLTLLKAIETTPEQE